MTHLAHIKQRIRTIEKTQTITRAMRLIAMSFYSKLEKNKECLRKYRKRIIELTSLARNQTTQHLPVFYPEDLSNTRPLLILCSSTKALCGSLNANLIRYFDKTFALDQAQTATFIAIGQRAQTYLEERYPGMVIKSFPEVSVSGIPKIAQAISTIITSQTTSFSSVRVYYTHLKSLFMQYPIKETLIPFSFADQHTPADQSALPYNHAQYLWEQPSKDICARIMERYLYTSLVSVIFDNVISENAARFIAMDQSTNNAKKYLDALSLDYNKSRQGLITREISALASNME